MREPKHIGHMSRYKLVHEIIARSEAKNWDQAILEWRLLKVDTAEEPETCLCGHYPIVELCTLRNLRNGRFAVVGNCCVKKFLRIRSDLIFNGFKRIAKDITKPLNRAAIDYATKQGWIRPWETRFTLNTTRKRIPTRKQMEIRQEINRKVLGQLNLKTSASFGPSAHTDDTLFS